MKKKLKYHTFDMDDNLLHLPSKIHLYKDGKLHKLSTSEFALYRKDPSYSPPNGVWEDAFIEFRDNKSKSNFLTIVKKAIKENSYAPSFNKFKNCLIGGHLFAIITARGHHSSAIRKGIKYIIKNVLNDSEKELMLSNLRTFAKDFDCKLTDKQLLRKYLDECEYIGVSHPDYVNKFKTLGANSPEEGKKMALKHFTLRVNEFHNKLSKKFTNVDVSLGFSDDDIHTVNKVKEFFKDDLSKNHKKIKFVVYDTSNKQIKKEIIK